MVEECWQQCAQAKGVYPKPKITMGHHLAARPNQILAIDFSYLEPTVDGHENALISSDVLSKFTQAVAIKNQMASTVAGVLVYESFFHFGVPAWIHTDQGKSFESTVIKELSQLYRV